MGVSIRVRAGDLTPKPSVSPGGGLISGIAGRA